MTSERLGAGPLEPLTMKRRLNPFDVMTGVLDELVSSSPMMTMLFDESSELFSTSNGPAWRS